MMRTLVVFLCVVCASWAATVVRVESSVWAIGPDDEQLHWAVDLSDANGPFVRGGASPGNPFEFEITESGSVAVVHPITEDVMHAVPFDYPGDGYTLTFSFDGSDITGGDAVPVVEPEQPDATKTLLALVFAWFAGWCIRIGILDGSRR